MAKRPSVLFLNRVYPPVRGATGRLLRDLARSFARDGWDVTILSAAPSARLSKARAKTPAKTFVKDGPIRLVRVPTSMKKGTLTRRNILDYLGIWVRLWHAGMKLPPHDLVVTLSDPPLLAVAGHLIARSKKSRHMHWCQDMYPDLLPVLGVRLPDFVMKGLARLAHHALSRCDRVVAVGRCMARRLIQNGVDAQRISVIPNWPDYELLHNRGLRGGIMAGFARANDSSRPAAAIPQAAAARPFEELFRDNGAPKFRILYSGNLGRAHPIGTILDAAEMLSRDHPDIEFVFVGGGAGQERLATERARRQLENIRFLPWQPASRLRELMESGDVHLVSMRQDALGLLVPSKLYSALAVARPCIFIGPPLSETARVINDFNAGKVVSQDDPETLARTIVHYRNDGQAWFAAHRGAAQAGQIFVPDQSIPEWLRRARGVLGLPATPARRPDGESHGKAHNKSKVA